MRIKITLIVALVVLTAAAGSWAWQDQQRGSGPGRIGANYGPPPSDQSAGAVRQQPVRPGSRPAYQQGYQPSGRAPYPDHRPGNAQVGVQPGTGVSRTGYADQPVYPYPPYRNPYYTGRSTGNLFSGLIDWIVEFPANVMGRFSNFMDEKVFPAAPATHGGSRGPNSDGPNARQAPPAKADPLPPAGVYKPRPR